MTDEIRLGVEWFPHKRLGRNTGGPVTCPLDGHFELIAPPGSGKGVSLEIPNLLLGLENVSVLSIDPSGQNAAVCAEARRRMGQDVVCLNPFGMHVARYPDLASAGCNPLAGISSRSPLFYQEGAAVADALIVIEGKDPHWTQSARGLIAGIVMWEILKAEREGRDPLLAEVRRMLCEPESYDPDAPGLTAEEKKQGGRLRSGLRYHAMAAIAAGHFQIADLVGRYIKEGSREIDSIASTARTQTEWLLSEPMRSDLRRNGVDWRRLAQRLATIFVIVPAEYLESQEGIVWLRLVTMSALRALFATGGRRNVDKIVLMLSEFAALGKLKAAESARSQGRKFGLRLWPVLQDIHQLNDERLYGRDGADSFAGQCRAVFAFAPGDYPSAEWMSRRSGEHDVMIESASENSGQPGVQRSYQLHRERRWPPERILELPSYHGLVWFHGRSAPVPVYAEPYIDERGRIRPQYLRAGARPDPYHDNSGEDYAPLPPHREHERPAPRALPPAPPAYRPEPPPIPALPPPLIRRPPPSR
jgi:type IV secretion system protein VirD4